MNMRRIQLNGLVTTLSEYCGRGPPILGVGLYSIFAKVDLLSSPNVLVYAELFYMISMFAHETPQAVVYVVDAWCSIYRIEEYLLTEEFNVSKDLQVIMVWKVGLSRKSRQMGTPSN